MPLDQVKNTNTLNPPWNSSVIYAPYIFESGPRLALESEFRKWWEYYYRGHGSRLTDVKVKFATKTNRNLRALLIPKKPSKQMLTRR